MKRVLVLLLALLMAAAAVTAAAETLSALHMQSVRPTDTAHPPGHQSVARAYGVFRKS